MCRCERLLTGESMCFGIFVAHTEDAKHYTAAPTFFNNQLMAILGLRKWEALDRARRAAIKAGWLAYKSPPLGTRRAGSYWSLVPDRFAKLDDQPSDEHHDHIRQTDTLGGTLGGTVGGNLLSLFLTLFLREGTGALRARNSLYLHTPRSKPTGPRTTSTATPRNS